MEELFLVIVLICLYNLNERIDKLIELLRKEREE
jgi:hypothetical protein